MKRLFHYFELSLAEQRGFIALSFLILVSLSIPYLYDAVRKDEVLTHGITVFDESEKSEVLSLTNPSNKKREEKPKKINMVTFDPNGLSADQWLDLGLSAKQIQVIHNYEAKGGRFRKKEDLARIYSISEEDYKRLAPYVQIMVTKEDRSSTATSLGTKWNTYENKLNEVKVRKTITVNIATADSAEWVALSGIGPVLANRIIKYRDALGGFNAVSQIAEVYGLPAETYTSIVEKLYLEDLTVKKMKINEVNIEELSKHPYISRKQAQWIVNYRGQHGIYKDLESLNGITLLNQDFLRKIEPYLEF